MFRIKSQKKQGSFSIQTLLPLNTALRFGSVLFCYFETKKKNMMKIYLHSIVIHVKHSIENEVFFSSSHSLFWLAIRPPFLGRRPYPYMPSKRTFRHTDTRCWLSKEKEQKNWLVLSQADKFTFLLYAVRTNSKYCHCRGPILPPKRICLILANCQRNNNE